MTRSPISPMASIGCDNLSKRLGPSFRSMIPSSQFPAEKDRYVLYFSHGCPWAHRALIAHAMKGLEEIVDLVEIDGRDPIKGWEFTGGRGPEKDPYHGARYLRELYLRSDPEYNGRVSVPVLWDLKNDTIVSNESSDILRMFSSAFDHLLPSENRETSQHHGGFRPPHLAVALDELNDWIFDTVNNGVYRVGLATSQAVYDDNITKVFSGLDRLEALLGEPGHSPFLLGDGITEADVRLFTTIIRFDVVYYTIFKCNLKMIRYDYPRLHEWMRRLYWDESARTKGAFRRTTKFDVIKPGYTKAFGGVTAIVPAGPVPNVLPL